MANKQRKGIFERLGWATPQEYKAFLRAYSNYNDSSSPDYHNDDILRKAGNNYLDHVLMEKGGLDDLKGAEKKRVNYVFNSITQLDKHIENEPQEIFKEPAINDVEALRMEKDDIPLDEEVQVEEVVENEINMNM